MTPCSSSAGMAFQKSFIEFQSACSLASSKVHWAKVSIINLYVDLQTCLLDSHVAAFQ